MRSRSRSRVSLDEPLPASESVPVPMLGKWNVDGLCDEVDSSSSSSSSSSIEQEIKDWFLLPTFSFWVGGILTFLGFFLKFFGGVRDAQAHRRKLMGISLG